MGWLLLLGSLAIASFLSDRVGRWVKRMLVGMDQLANAICFGNPDETISSRVGRGARKGNWLAIGLEPVIDALFWLLTRQWGHCRNNIEWDEVKP